MAGYPDRFAQLALGHNSKAVHRAYARNAQVTLSPLEDYVRNMATGMVIPLPQTRHDSVPEPDILESII